MSTGTPGVPRELAEACSRFVLAGPAREAVRWPGGRIHRSWRVDCGTRRYLFQQLNLSVFADPVALVSNNAMIVDHLAGKGGWVPPQPVPTEAGPLLWRDSEGRAWRGFHFVEGSRTATTIDGANEAAEVGRAVGAYQRGLADLEPASLAVTIPRFHDTPHRLATFEGALSSDSASRAEACAGLVDDLCDRKHLATLATGLPSRVVHNDPKVANVLFDTRGTALGLVDLDTTMAGTVGHDFGDMVRSGAASLPEDTPQPEAMQLRLDLLEGLCRGYLAETRDFLDPSERRALVPACLVLTYELALRFATDHLSGDLYYPAEEPGANARRARAQVALLRSMEEQMDTMAAIVDSAYEHRP